MVIAEEIQELIATGRFEYSLEKSNQALKTAVDLALEYAKTPSLSYHIGLLAKEAYKELALNEMRPSARSTLWLKALGALGWCKADELDQHASNYAELAVDVCQDPFSDMSISRRHTLLKQAKVLVDNFTHETKVDEQKAIALARKSAIIRLQAIGLTPEDRLRLLSEASRCSTLAQELSKNAAIMLECALVEWALARLQKDDKKYVDKLQSAEALFKHDIIRKSDVGPFAISRFYRLSYRYYDACLAFPELIDASKNRRRILREVSIYAESAIQLANLQYPKDVLEEHLNKAVNLLEIAISSGCKSAREVIALAYIRSLLEGAASGITALSDLCSGRRELSWEQALGMLSEVKEGDLIAEGFALGVTDSSSLTRLGSFSNRFLNNRDLAEALYRAAVRMNPHDAIAQTNLARHLLQRGDPADLREAERVLQLAQTFADRRFSWWRPVQIELKKIKDATVLSENNQDKSSTKDLPPFKRALHFRQIRQHYNKLKTCEDAHFRGYELEKLVYAISLLTCGFQRPSYRMTRPLVGKVHQFDAHIEHRGKSYRCECKWMVEKVSYDDMVKFADKLDAAGVSGLFISMSGFSDAAINKARELRAAKAVILVNGNEVDLVMTGSIHFDDLLTAKRRAFDSSSESYFVMNVNSHDG